MIRKTINLILFSMVLQGTIHSQPFGKSIPAYKIVRIDYENSSGERGTTFFRYDLQNKMIKAKWTLNDKSRFSTNYYEYDSKGNLISAFRNFSDGLTSTEIFNYDTAGNKLSEYFYRSDSITGSAFYQYNNKRLEQAKLVNYKGWLSGVITYTYNNKGQKKKGILTRDNKVNCEINYEYDSIGNLVKEFWDFNGKWTQTFHFMYEKKEQPKQFYSNPYLSGESMYRVSEENYAYNNEIGGPSLYHYNKNGLLEKKVFIRDDSLTTNTFFKYDNKSKLISSKRIYSDGSIAKFTYTYDENNKLLRRDFLKNDSLVGFEAYLYNSDGELTKAYLKNFDEWLSGTIDFKSDELGNIKNGIFTGENGFNASIIFVYNPEGLISEIRWDFSFGKFQQYQFEYEHINSL